MSKEAWELCKGECEGTLLADGNVKLNKVNVRWRQEEPTLVTSLGIEDAVRSYLPTRIVSPIDAGHDNLMAELRRVTVVFAK